MGLVDYGSGSDDSDTEQTSVVKPPTPKVEPKTSKPPAKRPPKKIAIALPALSAKRPDEDDESNHSDGPPTKKARTGVGKSSLLSMLPTPKSNVPVQQPRVLGSGSGPGLVFNSSRPEEKSTPHELFAPSEPKDDENVPVESAPQPGPSRPPSLLPPSLQKKRANISLEDTGSRRPAPVIPSAPAVDFFSLGTTKSTVKSSAPPAASSSSSPLPSKPSVSAAPSLPEFTPPEPSPYDAYPGYYQLPSGQWAMYEQEYYNKFAAKWKAEYDAHVRALEKGTVKGFEGMDEDDMQEVDPVEEMERAKKEVQEREERKALTKGAGGGPAQPKMKISASKMSGVARSRHQLATLLKDAYENRELLEEKIAEGRRNRKEAGNKYGF